MNKVITKLSENIIFELKTAEEIWIAVALINYQGLKFILDNVNPNCKQNYLIGIDLPTEPKALYELYKLKLKSNLKVKIYSEKEYFHPKLYLIQKGENFKGFVGSANCTIGGLNNNIELSIKLDDNENCKDLQSWFEKLYKISNPLTQKFIKSYTSKYEERIKREKEELKLVIKEKKELNEEITATFLEKEEFISTLKRYRKLKNHYEVLNERKESVEELRSSLDYPNFEDVNVDDFFSIWALGHIIALPKPTIKREIKKFKKLLKMLCDESIDISERYNNALFGNLKIRGINEGLISKILTLHKPELYYVKNNKTEKALKKFGIEIPRGMAKGDKYKITCNILRQICEETKIENLAVLDYYLYLEGNENE